jgi:hypothetical protein
MFCPQCGTVHTPGGRFCGNCGLLLPLASVAGATHARSPAITPGDARARTAMDSAPSLTLTVVACVVAFGLVFVAARALVRGGDSTEPGASVQAHNANAPQGAMGALLSGGRRTDPASAPRPPAGSPPAR